MWLRLAGGALVAGVIGALAAGLLTGDTAIADGGPACLFRAATGILCPFCGMTHATVALGAGAWGEAVAHHPLAPLVALAIAWCGYRLLRGRPLALFGRPIGPGALLAATGLVWIANLVAHA